MTAVLQPIASESHNYNGADLLALKKFILGSSTLSDEQKVLYDLSGQGLYNGMDLLLMKKIILGVGVVTTTSTTTDGRTECAAW